jgi:long-chain acyl-CoA synthetase
VAFKQVLTEGGRTPPKLVTITLDDIAFLQYTGGTTGRRKGAVLLHRNVAANVAQSEVGCGPISATAPTT